MSWVSNGLEVWAINDLAQLFILLFTYYIKGKYFLFV